MYLAFFIASVVAAPRAGLCGAMLGLSCKIIIVNLSCGQPAAARAHGVGDVDCDADAGGLRGPIPLALSNGCRRASFIHPIHSHGYALRQYAAWAGESHSKCL